MHKVTDKTVKLVSEPSFSDASFSLLQALCHLNQKPYAQSAVFDNAIIHNM